MNENTHRMTGGLYETLYIPSFRKQKKTNLGDGRQCPTTPQVYQTAGPSCNGDNAEKMMTPPPGVASVCAYVRACARVCVRDQGRHRLASCPPGLGISSLGGCQADH